MWPTALWKMPAVPSPRQLRQRTEDAAGSKLRHGPDTLARTPLTRTAGSPETTHAFLPLASSDLSVSSGQHAFRASPVCITWSHHIKALQFKVKQAIKRIPIISTLCKFFYYRVVEPFRLFPGSEDYWKTRYLQGGTSGDGSYNLLARFKAETINGLISQHSVRSVIEFGCGDGNQLTLAAYPCYIGVDVSPHAIQLCKRRFSGDPDKTFLTLLEYAHERAEMSLSLDVIYHLVEDSVFDEHMKSLFSAATRFVVIYSSNSDNQRNLQGKHIRHRRFSDWIDMYMSEWKLLAHVPNRYPYDGNDDTGSFADFHIYCHSRQ